MTIAIIGGSGLDQLSDISEPQAINKITPFGAHSDGVVQFTHQNLPIIFLARHGNNHSYPPHAINYRANLWLLKSLGVTKIIACNVVGGISDQMSPRSIVIPHQIIDYTWGRDHTFFDGANTDMPGVNHIDFTQPYSEALRQRVLAFLDHNNIPHIHYGTYGCTQGPRLETAAEVLRLKNDGCDIVGMTAMPEAALARELEIDYAAINIVVNWAPGIAAEELSMATMMQLIAEETTNIRRFLPHLIEFLALDH